MDEHYYTEKQTSQVKKTIVSYTFHGYPLSFVCVSGIFGSKKLDAASLLLLEHSKIEKNWHILDIGCGIGVLGISIKKASPFSTIVLTDINTRALKTTEENARKNNVTVEILKSDCYAELQGRMFDTIITNPPHHAGRALVYRIIEEATLHLNKNGFLQIVALHNKGGAMLEKKMKDVFGNVETLAKKSGFRVYCSKKE